MSRVSEKIKLEDICFDIMSENQIYCNDNTHLLACKMIKNEFNVNLTPEMISRLRSIDRSRQKVLKNNPYLDKRKKSFQLEQQDREYYRQ